MAFSVRATKSNKEDKNIHVRLEYENLSMIKGKMFSCFKASACWAATVSTCMPVAASPVLTSDYNYNPHIIERGFIQISHVTICKITPLNITYCCLFGDKMSCSVLQ